MVYKAFVVSEEKFGVMFQPNTEPKFWILNGKRKSIRPANTEEVRDFISNPRVSLDDVSPVLDALKEVYSFIEKVNLGLQQPRT